MGYIYLVFVLLSLFGTTKMLRDGRIDGLTFMIFLIMSWVPVVNVVIGIVVLYMLLSRYER